MKFWLWLLKPRDSLSLSTWSPDHSKLVEKIKNLGITMDGELSFMDHISSIIKTVSFQLFPFPFLSDSGELMNAFVISRLDYCSSLFMGLSNKTIHRLQFIHNSATQMTKRSDLNTSSPQPSKATCCFQNTV